MGPENPPPPYYPPPGPGGGYPPPAGYGGPAPSADVKSVLSLVLGILSIFGVWCFGGILLGVPAIILGVLGRKDAERSGGMVGGAGLGLAGIITGGLGVFAGLATILLFAGGIASGILEGIRGAHAPAGAGGTPTTPFTPPVTPPAAVSPTSIDVVDLAPGGRLRDRLQGEQRAASARREVVIVQTTATWCHVCREIEASLGDARMESALAGVRLVRVDIDRFTSELKANRMYEGSVPWFYRLNADARPVDAISSDEWDDNIPENMAPVLGPFVKGTYTARRHPGPIGTSL